MSAVITSLSSVSVESFTEAPGGGSTTAAAPGQVFGATNPDLATNPMTVVMDASATSASEAVTIPIGVNALVSVTGSGEGPINIMGANIVGAEQDASGAAIGISETYAGKVFADFSSSFISGDKTIDGTAKLGGATSSIGDNAPGGSVAGINLYINTGTGADEIGGSDKHDFVRAGAGDDVVNAGAGDDIVRLGSGSDEATLGKGDDNLYMTVDQLGDGDVNTIKDFDSNGNDKITFNKDIEGRVTITGQGTNSIVITLSGDRTATTTITSTGETIDTDDITFV